MQIDNRQIEIGVMNMVSNWNDGDREQRLALAVYYILMALAVFEFFVDTVYYGRHVDQARVHGVELYEAIVGCAWMVLLEYRLFKASAARYRMLVTWAQIVYTVFVFVWAVRGWPFTVNGWWITLDVVEIAFLAYLRYGQTSYVMPVQRMDDLATTE